MNLKTKIPSILVLAVLAIAVAAPAQARPGGAGLKGATRQTIPRGFRLSTVKVKGKVYYRTFRVTSRAGLARLGDKKNVFRFFQGDGQYGEAFYLFRTRGDARKFARAEASHRAVKRDVIAEVLLPKETFDSVKKAVVGKDLDWSMQKARTEPAHQKLRDLRNASHLVLGRWAASPYADEPMYRPLNGAKQLAVVQRGMPSILNQAVIRIHETYGAKK